MRHPGVLPGLGPAAAGDLPRKSTSAPPSVPPSGRRHEAACRSSPTPSSWQLVEATPRAPGEPGAHARARVARTHPL